MSKLSRVRLLGAALACLVAAGFAGLSAGPAQAATSEPAINSPDVAATTQPAPPDEPPADPAASASGKDACDPHSLCLWQNINFNASGRSGFWEWTTGAVAADEWKFVGTDANDKASSIWNNRTNAMGIAKNAPANAPFYCLVGGFSDTNLTNNVWRDGTNMNDSISSRYLSSNPNSCLVP